MDQLRKPFVVSFVIFVLTAGVLLLWTQNQAPSPSPSAPMSPTPVASSG